MSQNKLHKDIAKFIGNDDNQHFQGHLNNNFDFLILSTSVLSNESNEPDHDFYNIKIW